MSRSIGAAALLVLATLISGEALAAPAASPSPGSDAAASEVMRALRVTRRRKRAPPRTRAPTKRGGPATGVRMKAGSAPDSRHQDREARPRGSSGAHGTDGVVPRAPENAPIPVAPSPATPGHGEPAPIKLVPVRPQPLPAAPPFPGHGRVPSDALRTLRAARRTGPISIDGKVDEAAWNAAEVGTGFTQTEPTDGAPATVPTRFRILWDDDAIYVGVECDDVASPTLALAPRDEDVDGDFVVVDLSPSGDHRTAYHFAVYASGQQLDGMHIDDTDFDLDWNAVWESATHVGKHGWSVEMRIPLRIMRIPEHVTEFGLSFSRTIARTRETEYWQYHPRSFAGGVSGYGTLTNLDGLKPVSSFELLPYISGRAYRNLPSAPGVAPMQFTPCLQLGIDPARGVESCAGLDLRYAITGDLKLTASLNPDFGEVEPDQRVQNLTNTEIYQPERRAFFMQGKDLLSLPASGAWQPFYSRRIGETLYPSTSPGVLFTPAASPVAGAIELSGTMGGTDVQALSAYELGASALLQAPGGGIVKEQEAPPLLSTVVRVRHRMGDDGVWGMMATDSEPTGDLHARVGVVDLALADSTHTWSFAAQLGGSALAGTERVVNLDGSVLTGGSTGLGFSAVAARHGAGLVGNLSVDMLTPQFTVDALGFMPRANLLDVQGSIGWRALRDGHWWRSQEVNLRGDEQHDFAGVLLRRKLLLESLTTFRNYWSTSVAAGLYGQAFDDRELGDGTPFERPAYLDFRGAINSDDHGRWSAGLSAEQQQALHLVGHSTSIGGNFSVRPLRTLRGSFMFDLENATGDIRRLRYATELPEAGGDPEATIPPDLAPLVPRLYLFAPQSSRSIDARVRITAVPMPRLSIQAFAQVFLAGLSWGAPLRAAVGPGQQVVTLASLRPALSGDYAPNGDYRESAVDLNLQVKWEWRPGATISLAYMHTSYSSVDGPWNPTAVSLGLRSLNASGALQNDVVFARFDMLIGR